MPKKVKKRDGREEEFQKEKIVTSAMKAGAPVDIARDIAKEIEDQPDEEVQTKEIAKIVLKKLRSYHPEWESKWVKHDQNARRLKKYRG